MRIIYFRYVVAVDEAFTPLNPLKSPYFSKVYKIFEFYIVPIHAYMYVQTKKFVVLDRWGSFS